MTGDGRLTAHPGGEEDSVVTDHVSQLTTLQYFAGQALSGLVTLAPERAEGFVGRARAEVLTKAREAENGSHAALFGQAAACLGRALGIPVPQAVTRISFGASSSVPG